MQVLSMRGIFQRQQIKNSRITFLYDRFFTGKLLVVQFLFENYIWLGFPV